MPVAPVFHWEQTAKDIILQVQVKGVKKEAVDVFISDVFVKVNAASTYLLQLDLVDSIDVTQSKFNIHDHVLKILLPKQKTGKTWEALCIDKKTPHAEVQERRAAALKRAEELYNMKLDTREKQKEVERKRMLEDQWEMERLLRADIERKVKQEKETEQRDLYEWEGEVKKAAPKTPAELFQQAAAAPPVRQLETTNVPITFSAKVNTMPTRSRTDEDYYRKSKYKPVRVEDSPIFWKEKGDKLFKSRDWKGACEAYSESLKRDGSFLACVSNRAATYIQLGEYKKAIEDCDLSINMLSNIPASDTTQDAYRRTLIRLYVRRGAALCWDAQIEKGLEDYRLAAAYRDEESDADVVSDMEAIVSYMKSHGLVEHADPADTKRSDAGQLYFKGNYAAAADMYRELLAENEFDIKARSNLCATYLQQGAFQSALEECNRLIEFCAEVAQALNEPGAQGSAMEDSDDEDDCEDELVAKKLAAAKTIQEKSGHVYLLLKSYVRAGAAYCGLGDLAKGYEMFERALRITPYDDDLRDDANRILEKMRMKTLVSATQSHQTKPPAAK